MILYALSISLTIPRNINKFRFCLLSTTRFLRLWLEAVPGLNDYPYLALNSPQNVRITKNNIPDGQFDKVIQIIKKLFIPKPVWNTKKAAHQAVNHSDQVEEIFLERQYCLRIKYGSRSGYGRTTAGIDKHPPVGIIVAVASRETVCA